MSIAGYLHEFAVRSVAVLGGNVETSILLRYRGVSVRAASSNAAAGRCDQVEARSGEGLCVDAMDSGDLLIVRDLASEVRWPEWLEAATGEGFVTAAAVPAEIVDGMSLALNVYSRAPIDWSDEIQEVIGAYAELAAAAVRLHLERSPDDQEFDDDAGDPGVVERAVGAIMHANGCGADEARELIATSAQNAELTQRAVARTILEALVPGEGDRAGV
jgi:hypothetical protein